VTVIIDYRSPGMCVTDDPPPCPRCNGYDTQETIGRRVPVDSWNCGDCGLDWREPGERGRLVDNIGIFG
jgi:hypothetical protein